MYLFIYFIYLFIQLFMYVQNVSNKGTVLSIQLSSQT